MHVGTLGSLRVHAKDVPAKLACLRPPDAGVDQRLLSIMHLPSLLYVVEALVIVLIDDPNMNRIARPVESRDRSGVPVVYQKVENVKAVLLLGRLIHQDAEVMAAKCKHLFAGRVADDFAVVCWISQNRDNIFKSLVAVYHHGSSHRSNRHVAILCRVRNGATLALRRVARGRPRRLLGLRSHGRHFRFIWIL